MRWIAGRRNSGIALRLAAIFLTVGLASLLWLVPWITWMPLRTAVAVAPISEQGGEIWRILQERSLWGTCLGLFCTNYYLYFLLTWLPFYLVHDRGLSIQDMSRVAGLDFFLMAASAIVCGKISDWWIAAGGSATQVRKTFIGAGTAGVGVFLAVSAVAPAPVYLWTLGLVGIFLGMATSNIWAVTQTLAGPRMAGRWTGVQNFLANFSGVIGPALAGFLVDKTERFEAPFFVAAGVAWLGTVSWIFVVGRVEQVNWESAVNSVSLTAPSQA